MVTFVQEHGKKNKKASDRRITVEKLRNRYRLVILNEETFEEKFSAFLSPMNVFIYGGLIIILLIAMVTVTISFTPLREYIPGYADVTTKRQAIYASYKADSLEKELRHQQQYLDNVRAILSGEPIERGNDVDSVKGGVNYQELTVESIEDDSVLKNLIESEDQYNLGAISNEKEGLHNIFLYPPVKGIISSAYNLANDHFGIDITAGKNETVKAILGGTVIFSSWTAETGYVIQVQHPYDLVSTYKHNSRLLKSMGESVVAGEAISIIGNSGELSTGPHLHFELWHKGKPVNPEDYILF